MHHRNSGRVGAAAHDQPQPLRPEIGWQVRRLGRGQVRIIRSASPSGVAFPLPRAARRNRLQNGRQIRVRAKALGENGEAVAAYTGALAAGEAHHDVGILPQAPVRVHANITSVRRGGVARAAGVSPLILGDAIEGEAREVGKVMAGIARQAARHGQPAQPPCVLISGGETTVTIRGGGRGGRNVEYLLSLAIELDGLPGVFAVAGGVDGAEDVAGALIAPDTLARAAAEGVRAKERLADNDGHAFFEAWEIRSLPVRR